MLDTIGKDFGKSTRWGMLQDVKRNGITSRPGAKALEITPGGIKIETQQGIEKIPADTIVMAAGSRSENALANIIKARNIPFDVVGDADTIGMAFDAVHKGYAVGMKI